MRTIVSSLSQMDTKGDTQDGGIYDVEKDIAICEKKNCV